MRSVPQEDGVRVGGRRVHKSQILEKNHLSAQQGGGVVSQRDAREDGVNPPR